MGRFSNDQSEPSHRDGQQPSRGSHGDDVEVTRLKQEITSTTQEANARIQQASDAIRTLKERLGSKHLEHDKLRSDTARLKREAQALEQENEQLRKCGVTLTGTREDRDVEVKRLQRDVEVLTEQKEALVLILQDLYGAVGDKTPQSLSPQQAELK